MGQIEDEILSLLKDKRAAAYHAGILGDLSDAERIGLADAKNGFSRVTAEEGGSETGQAQ